MRAIPTVGATIAFSVLYFGVTHLSGGEVLGGGVRPAAGVAVAMLLVSSSRRWPAILAVVGAVELGSGLVADAAQSALLVTSAAHVIEPLVAAFLIRRVRAESLESVRDVGWFVLNAFLASAASGLVAATGGSSSLGFGEAAVLWTIGGGLGILTAASVGVLLVGDVATARRLFARQPALVLGIVLAASLLVFGLLGEPLLWPYLTWPPLMWAALRGDMVEAAAAAFLTTLVASIATELGVGAFALGITAGGPLLALQGYVFVVTVTVLAVATRTHERDVQRRVVQSERSRADREETLARVARVALTAEDRDELQRTAAMILQPVVGSDAVRDLISDPRGAMEHSRIRLDQSRIDGGASSGDTDLGGFGASVSALMATAFQRMDAEERLRRVHDLQRIAGGLARVGGWAIELPDQTVYWSDEIHDILAYPGEDAAGLDEGLARYTDAHKERVTRAVEACGAEGTPFDMEVEVETFAEEVIWVRVAGEAQRDDSGLIVRIVGALQDTTMLRQAAAETTDMAERLTATVESITDALVSVDHDWCITYVNRSAEELLHRERDTLLGRNLWEELPEEADGPLREASERVLRGHTSAEMAEYYLSALGTWFSIRAYPSSHGLAVYFRDVTEQRASLLALRDREARLVEQAALLDKARDAIIVCDLDDRITYWNHSAELLYGWTAEEAIGERSRQLLCKVPAAHHEATINVHRDGEWVGELTQQDRSGVEWLVESRWTLVRDDDGRARSVLSINADITERRRLEEQLLRAQRMESIGALAGGIAHNLNNVLTPIMMSASMLEEGEADKFRLELIDAIRSSTQRGADVVRQILTFARGVEGDRITVDINDLLGEVHRIAEDTFLKTIAMQREVAPDLWPVAGDPTQLHQVLLNLCVNARDAMPDGGVLRLAAHNIVVDDHYAALSDGATPGAYVCVRVEDTGHGMSADARDRIFDPFYTTKPLGQGTGLGLSVSAGIIASHGGFIRVYSEPGKGTRFLVHIPATDGAAEVETSRGPEPLPTGADELVLIIDDEVEVLATLRRSLEQFGYRVVQAGDGAQAIAVLTLHATEVDVVLTDMMMPGMDAATIIRALHDIRPHLPVIAASGLHAQRRILEEKSVEVSQFLPKPFTLRAMLTAIHDALRPD